MKTTRLGALALTGLLAAVAFAVSPGDGQIKPAGDSRLDKLIEQNELILKNQQEILKSLGELKQDILQIRRRSS
jgi:hypothetical protein